MPHFEIHASDTARARQFYSGLLGWDFAEMDAGDGSEYFIATSDTLGMDSALTVGLMKRTTQAPKAGTPIRGGTMTFEVTDVDERYGWALKNGGGEALPPTDYPGIGRAAYCEDGEGNVVGMIKPVEGN